MTEQPEETRTGQEQDFAMGPMVSVVFRSGDNPDPFPFSDLALEGDDPALISDDTLIERVARWLDRDVNDFDNMVVTRPETGNLLISPKAVYGKKKILVSFILDETGSMQTVKGQTIEGFNEYVESLQNDDNADKMRFTLTKFNSEKVEIVHEEIKLADVEFLDDENYQPDDLTPLYDAIGRTIRSAEKAKKSNVLIVIQTDGRENASVEYDQRGIFDLIDEKKKDGWTFAFLGCDQDAFLESEKIGIPQASVMQYDKGDTKGAMLRTSEATLNYAASGGRQSSAFFEDDDG